MVSLDQIRLVFPIFVVAALVVAMDLIVMPILIGYYQQETAIIVFIWDFSVVLLAGLASLFLARRVGCPLWWLSHNNSLKLGRSTHITVALGLAVVIANSTFNIAFYMVDPNQALQVAPWIVLLNPERAIALSLRAALNEEMVFRLFLFLLVTWIVLYFKQSPKVSLALGGLVSSIAFGFIHGSGFIPAFLVGLALVYIYNQQGLLPAMTVHFFADAVPFLFISMTL